MKGCIGVITSDHQGADANTIELSNGERRVFFDGIFKDNPPNQFENMLDFGQQPGIWSVEAREQMGGVGEMTPGTSDDAVTFAGGVREIGELRQVPGMAKLAEQHLWRAFHEHVMLVTVDAHQTAHALQSRRKGKAVEDLYVAGQLIGC